MGLPIGEYLLSSYGMGCVGSAVGGSVGASVGGNGVSVGNGIGVFVGASSVGSSVGVCVGSGVPVGMVVTIVVGVGVNMFVGSDSAIRSTLMEGFVPQSTCVLRQFVTSLSKAAGSQALKKSW